MMATLMWVLVSALLSTTVSGTTCDDAAAMGPCSTLNPMMLTCSTEDGVLTNATDHECE